MSITNNTVLDELNEIRFRILIGLISCGLIATGLMICTILLVGWLE